MEDFAHRMRWLVDEAYPDAPVVRVVLDNLNTHRMASLYETFPAAESRRIVKRLEFHHKPKPHQLAEHGGDRVQRVDPGLSPGAQSRRACPATSHQPYEAERNAAKATINWRFNTQDARAKLHHLYPFNSKIG